MTDSIRDLLRVTADRAATYLETLDQRGVAPTPDAVERLRELDEPLPDSPSAPEKTLAVLDEISDGCHGGAAFLRLRHRWQRTSSTGR